MSTSLSKLADNLSEGLHNNRSVECKSYLDYMKTKDEKLILRCFGCKKNYEKDFNKELIGLQIHIIFTIMILINSFCY